MKNRKFTEWPQIDLKHLAFTNVPFMQWILTRDAHNFLCMYFALRPAVFEIQKSCRKLEMYEPPQTDSNHLRVKRVLYTKKNACHWDPHFGLCRATTSRLRDTKLSKIRMHWMTSKWTWTLNSQSDLYTPSTYPRLPNINPYWSTTSNIIFRDTKSRKIGKKSQCTQWPQCELVL